VAGVFPQRNVGLEVNLSLSRLIHCMDEPWMLLVDPPHCRPTDLMVQVRILDHTKDMRSSFFPLCWGVPEPCSNAWKGQPRSLKFYPLIRTNYTVSSTFTASTLYTSSSNSDARLSDHQKPGGGSKEDSPPSAICPIHRGRPVNRPTPYAERR